MQDYDFNKRTNELSKVNEEDGVIVKSNRFIANKKVIKHGGVVPIVPEASKNFLNINPNQRDQDILDMDDKFNQEISEKDLEIYKLKQMLREAEMNKKYESPYESSFVSKNMHNVGIELQPVRYIEKRKVENGADDSEREKRLKRAKEKQRKFLENNKKKEHRHHEENI